MPEIQKELVNRSNYEALRNALRHAVRYLDGLDRNSVAATASLAQLRDRFGGSLPDQGESPSRVIEELVAASEGGLNASASGRFFAWVIGGTLESAMAADWLTSVWDQNAAMFSGSPAASVAEETAGRWLKELFGLPDEASFALVTGCQLAHFTCLAAARWSVLRDHGWDVKRDGMFGAPPIRVIAGDQRHGTVDSALGFLGFGQTSVVTVATDADGKMEVVDLRRALRASSGPTVVVLGAGDINVAAFDSFNELIPVAKAAGAWVHIDGAFGLFARASQSKRWMVDGIQDADSWATDGHKWLNVPFDTGFAFVRDQQAHRASMSATASYIAPNKEARDQIDWNPEWSRRARGFCVYAALRELGKRGVQQLVDHCCQRARALVRGIGQLEGAEVLWEPHLNQGLVRFPDPSPQATAADHDAHTDSIIAAVNQTGEAFFSGTTWRGKRAMRVSVVNWRTSDEDVHRTIRAVAAVLQS